MRLELWYSIEIFHNFTKVYLFIFLNNLLDMWTDRETVKDFFHVGLERSDALIKIRGSLSDEENIHHSRSCAKQTVHTAGSCSLIASNLGWACISKW